MSDDPSQVDTATLLVSMRRDIAVARAKLVEVWQFLDAANVTAWELENRARATTPPAAPAKGPDSPP